MNYMNYCDKILKHFFLQKKGQYIITWRQVMYAAGAISFFFISMNHNSTYRCMYYFCIFED